MSDKNRLLTVFFEAGDRNHIAVRQIRPLTRIFADGNAVVALFKQGIQLRQTDDGHGILAI